MKGFINQNKRQPESQKALDISTAQEFEAQIISGITLANFYSTECESCEKLEKILDKLATQFANTADVNIVKVNCDEEELKGLCENEEVFIYFLFILVFFLI